MDIKEVALQAGVSVATVSRALNGRSDVSAATRQRIVALAEELGYSPNNSARALARRRSDMVGLIWDTTFDAEGRRQPFLQDLLLGVKQALSETGYHLMLLATVEADTAVDAYLRAARQHNLDGVIMMSVDGTHPAITALVEDSIPTVSVDRPVHGPYSVCVTSDNRSGAAQAVQHLYELGHLRIATITGLSHLMPTQERLAGYRYQLARLGLPYRPEYVVEGDFFLASGVEGMNKLLALDEPPTAVFAAGDEMALGALRAASDAGVSVPGDVAVVGFDDIEAAALVRPALTTISQDHGALGAAVAAALLDVIAAAGGDKPAGGGSLPGYRILPTTLVVRESCGAVR